MRVFAVVAATLFLAGGAARAAEIPALPGVVAEGEYETGTLGRILQPAPVRALPDTRYGVGALPLYPGELVAAAGVEAVRSHCNICHSQTYITMQPPLAAPKWAAEVEKMRTTFGAKQYISDEAAQVIVTYLQQYYTPETRKP